MLQWWAAVLAQGRAVVTAATTTIAALLHRHRAHGRAHSLPAICGDGCGGAGRTSGRLCGSFLRGPCSVFAGEIRESAVRRAHWVGTRWS